MLQVFGTVLPHSSTATETLQSPISAVHVTPSKTYAPNTALTTLLLSRPSPPEDHLRRDSTPDGRAVRRRVAAPAVVPDEGARITAIRTLLTRLETSVRTRLYGFRTFSDAFAFLR